MLATTAKENVIINYFLLKWRKLVYSFFKTVNRLISYFCQTIRNIEKTTMNNKDVYVD